MNRVLFVDDDHDFLRILKHEFEGQVEGTFVYTGAEGLEQLKYNHFDAVVLDLMMFLDGVTFVKLANGRLRNASVYFLSCLDTEEVKKKVVSVKDRVSGIFRKDRIDLLKKELTKEVIVT